MVMPDGRLGVLDFGSVKRFSREFFEGHRDVFRLVLEQKPIDVLALVRRVGFTVELPDDEARALLEELIHLAGRALRTDDYDYAHDTMAPDSRKLFARHAAQFLKIRPPAEGVMFIRAFGGLQQNLRLLGARGDFRPFYRSLPPTSRLTRWMATPADPCEASESMVRRLVPFLVARSSCPPPSSRSRRIALC